MRRVRFLLTFLACLLSVPTAARPLVAVIDSGIARTDELRPYLIGEIDVASPRPRPAFQPRFDHGTMIATVLQRTAGGKAAILSLRVDEPAGCPSGRNPPCQRNPGVVAWAIYQAVAHRADVINISMALPDAPVISRAIAFAAWHGTQVVLASGNDARHVPGNLGHARAGYPNAVLVGALNRDGTPWPKTNRPATDATDGYIFTWRWGADMPTVGLNGPKTASGTSLAAPIEAGLRLRAKAAAGPSLLLGSAKSRIKRRPVMLAGTMYPDVRAKLCKAGASGRVSARCLSPGLMV